MIKKDGYLVLFSFLLSFLLIKVIDCFFLTKLFFSSWNSAKELGVGQVMALIMIVMEKLMKNYLMASTQMEMVELGKTLQW